LGLAINAPFGFTTKPENTGWAGSPISITSKTVTFDINPTLAYRLTPEFTIGVGVQIEYLSTKLTHGTFNSFGGPLVGARSFDGDDWGLGATVGVIWQPSRATSIGLGYRSAVSMDLSGRYVTTSGLLSGPALSAKTVASLTLPDEVTLGARHRLTDQVSLLGTVEWQNWSRIQNVSAVGSGCAPPAGVCETLNLNYRDGWFYSFGAEYASSPWLTLRAGLGYELSPIQDSTRDILLPDSNRIHLNFGASYKHSDQLTFDFGYAHVFFENGPFCIANAALNAGTSHCHSATAPTAVLLSGRSEVSVDVLSLGMKYKF
jgi:long-chain fatty acid transport protein